MFVRGELGTAIYQLEGVLLNEHVGNKKIPPQALMLLAEAQALMLDALTMTIGPSAIRLGTIARCIKCPKEPS